MIRALLLSLVATTTLAHARPTITVDESVPFTAKDLADAIEIRVRDTNARIHIARSGDSIVITVGDRARVLEVDNAPPRDLARVVALVIISIGDSPARTSTAPLAPARISTAPLAPAPPDPPARISIAPLAPAPPEPPAPPDPPSPPDPPAPLPTFDGEAPPDAPSIHLTADSTRPPSRYALRASLGYQRTDGGIFTTPFLASLATSISDQVRFVVSGGVDRHGTHISTTTSALGRLGLEGRFGALGIEIGGAGFAFQTCASDVGTAGGFYGTARIYLPVTQRARLAIEAGGYYMNTDFVTCGESLAFGGSDPAMETRDVFDEYAGHVGLGVEWGL